MRPLAGGFSRRKRPWSPILFLVSTTTASTCTALYLAGVRPALGSWVVTTRPSATATRSGSGRRLVSQKHQTTTIHLHRRMSRTEAAAEDVTDNRTPQRLHFCDIGANLLDARYTRGEYHGTVRHERDWENVLQRAVEAGCDRIVVTAGTVEDSRRAVALARAWNQERRNDDNDLRLFCTVGVHPTRCQQVFVDDPERDADSLLDELLAIAQDGMADGTVVAIGEIGLDYDRLEFCPAEIQQEFFQRQLARVAQPTGLPLFLHNRSVGDDLYNILVERDWKHGGVVHSFDDTLDLATKFMELGLFIGLNGCSLRTDENLETAKSLPLDRLLLETDCPYCDVRKTHAGYQYIQTHFPAKSEKKFERGSCVKSRQEPCHIVQVAEIIAGCQGVPLSDVAEACYQNSHELFRWNV